MGETWVSPHHTDQVSHTDFPGQRGHDVSSALLDLFVREDYDRFLLFVLWWSNQSIWRHLVVVAAQG